MTLTAEEEDRLKTKLGDSYREIRRLRGVIQEQERIHQIKLEALRRDFKIALEKVRNAKATTVQSTD